jgi:hypothetical protein
VLTENQKKRIDILMTEKKGDYYSLIELEIMNTQIGGTYLDRFLISNEILSKLKSN